eukprot:CAMPEP_0185770844 /NCGR_PEP_ID=MMETSP1174-20130828/61470_1 /TAXON_ID=35687 /ORGANISM="Dictyocha speculum, Strain CCMP1381" /LENGTH=61 /DNA_ID=CAMNT_0028456453 /DNA_START=210 /DNA_END=395 /DNA_ORIENTATION=-
MQVEEATLHRQVLSLELYLLGGTEHHNELICLPVMRLYSPSPPVECRLALEVSDDDAGAGG